MGQHQSYRAIECIESEFERVQRIEIPVGDIERNINFTQLQRFNLPESMRINTAHVAILYVMDFNKDGLFSIDDFLNFVNWIFTVLPKENEVQDVTEVVQSRCVLKMWSDCEDLADKGAGSGAVDEKGPAKFFVDWCILMLSRSFPIAREERAPPVFEVPWCPLPLPPPLPSKFMTSQNGDVNAYAVMSPIPPEFFQPTVANSSDCGVVGDSNSGHATSGLVFSHDSPYSKNKQNRSSTKGAAVADCDPRQVEADDTKSNNTQNNGTTLLSGRALLLKSPLGIVSPTTGDDHDVSPLVQVVSDEDEEDEEDDDEFLRPIKKEVAREIFFNIQAVFAAYTILNVREGYGLSFSVFCKILNPAGDHALKSSINASHSHALFPGGFNNPAGGISGDGLMGASLSNVHATHDAMLSRLLSYDKSQQSGAASSSSEAAFMIPEHSMRVFLLAFVEAYWDILHRLGLHPLINF